ncbi:MAG: hypothetical protein MJ078_08860, partial [Clostridia bacterium]|nr:hypothetical protein [Clostridia bacterium]
YSTTKLTLQKTTVYDTEKYDAFALYQNANGENVSVPINSGATTYLDGIPFGKTQIKITLTDKTDEKNQTVYVFNALRPRDTTNTVKASGITLLPEGRELSPAKYQSQPEGTFFKCDSSGVLTSGTGVASKQNDYRVFAIEKLSSFSLSFTATTAYTHIRYTSDEGKTYKELPQGGGMTDVISLPEAGAKVVCQLLDDKTFTENGGFSGTTNDYTVFVEQVKAGEPAYILSASADGAELFPALRNDVLSYSLIVPNGSKECDMTFTVSEGASVSLGKTALMPEDGAYKITLKTTAQTVDVTNKDGITNNIFFISFP